MLHNWTTNCPAAAWCFGSVPHRSALPESSISSPSWQDQRAAVLPSYARSVQADDACFISAGFISGHEVMWAAEALKSRNGFKRLDGNACNAALSNCLSKGRTGFLVWLERDGFRQYHVSVIRTCNLMKPGPDVEFAPFQQLMNCKIIQTQFSVSFKVLASYICAIISPGTNCLCPLVVFLSFRLGGFLSPFSEGWRPFARFPDTSGMWSIMHNRTEKCSKAALSSQRHGTTLQVKISVFKWCAVRKVVPVLGKLCTESRS